MSLRTAVLLFASISPLATAGGARAQEIPPHTVETVFVSDTIPDFGAVGGVAVDAYGYVYVADFRNAVFRIHPDGGVEKFADGLYGSSGNAIGPKGDLFQSSFNGNYIARVDRTGEWEIYADSGLNGPVGIAAAPTGELFVVNCTEGAISRVAVDRTVSEFARSELFTCPNGITFDDRGDLYVVNFSNTKVVRVEPDGTAHDFATVPSAGGNGHITFARGAFYVTTFRGNQIYRVSRDGTVALLAGTGQPGEEDGPASTATMTRPNGIGVSPNGKELWVNDFTTGTGVGPSQVTMRKITLTTLTDVLAGVDPADGPEPVRAIFDAYHAARPDEDTTAEIGTLGFGWLNSPNWSVGVALMEMGAEHFSDHPLAHFNLGEAYRFTGQTARAADQYRRVLELSPDFPGAASRLAQVGG